MQVYTPKEFQSDPSNWAFAQDPRGVIFVGNANGVLEFDGLRWRLIRTANQTMVRSLAVDAGGRIWVGAKGEIGFLEPDAAGDLRYVSALERLPPEARDFGDVWKAFATPEGVAFATFRSLLGLHGTGARVWSPATRFHLAFRARDRLFVVEVGRGLLELVDGQLRPVPGGERFAEERISALLDWDDPVSGAKTILACSRTQGLFVLEGAAFRPFPTEIDDALRRDLPYVGTLLPDDTLALGTLQGGLYVIDRHGRLREHLSRARGLPDDVVYALGLDREGGLWLGLDRGIARLQTGSPLTRFDEGTGIPGSVYSLHRHEGRLYVGTSQGALRLEAGPEPRFGKVRGIDGQTWAFVSVGTSLLVASFGGVYEIRGTTAVRVRKESAGALCASRVVPGRVFVGLGDGLASLRLGESGWVDEGVVPGVSGEIGSLLEMPDGSLWVGTTASGFLRVRFPDAPGRGAPRVERFGVAQGVPNLNDNNVYGSAEEPLFATHGGVFRFDEARRRFEPDPRFARLFPAGPRWLYALSRDRDGRVWMQTAEQAGEVKEAGAAVPGPDGSYAWDPKPFRPSSGSAIWSSHADDDGVVWLGGEEGLLRYDPGAAKDYAPPFRALLRRVSRAGGGAVLFGGSGPSAVQLLDHADNDLRFEYAAPGFDHPEATRFQVLLEGNDGDWSPWTAESYREYTNLREGAYSFRVRARNVWGTVSEEAVFPFRVRSPWYRTPWAYLAYLLAGAGFVTGLVRWRVRAVEAEKAALARGVAERTAELAAANEKLARLSRVDGLTGVSNRRRLDEAIDEEWRRGARNRTPLALLLLDVDHFKAYNDAFGHQAGDACLVALAGAIAALHTRAGDVVARYGGEEFAVLLPGAAHGAALAAAERIRSRVLALGLPHPASTAGPTVSVSIGVASLVPGQDATPSELVGAADRALYEAKRGGRNQVCAPA